MTDSPTFSRAEVVVNRPESHQNRPAAPLARATATVGALTLVSRLTGFARVLVVAAVLGRGALGDTYQTANTVPNLLFELFAAGALQAVLVPSLVEVLDRDGRTVADRLAGAILGALLSLLSAVVAVAAVAAPWIMRALTAGSDQAVHDAKVELGTLLLWFFLPQVLFYALGLVATAVLNGEHRFNVPAIAPAVNNVVVMATYVVFWVMRDGAAPSLDLTTAEKWVLAGGTTLGVIAFTTLPALAARRVGYRLRPHGDLASPTVRTVARRGAWAGGQLAVAQVLLAAVLVLANGTSGGVVTWAFAFAFFLLPYSLFALPVATTLFPGLARSFQAGRHDDFGASLARGTRATVVLLVGAAAALAALAWPIVRVAAFGDAREGGLGPLAHAIVAFAPGLVGYGLVFLFTRALYAVGDARTPMLASAAGTGFGVVAMIVASAVAPTTDRAAALAGAFGAAYLLSAGLMARALLGRFGPLRRALGALLVRVVLAGGAALAIMAVVVAWLDPTSRAASVATIVVAGGAGVAVYAAALRVLTGLSPRALVSVDG
ncbi:MAG TPA: lipid II flippase MurJ [Acidimicrobiales bacterium]|nr:lipid II flippase MurJ [Acidimicrobiales bacterium]